MSRLNFLKDELDRLKKENLYVQMPVLGSEQKSHIILNGKPVITLASNNYLGFANHSRLRKAAIEAIHKWGFGTGAVRMINGTMDIHIEFEKDLAAFKKEESSLVFVAGIAANRGTIQALMGEGDVIISDELNHGSIIDGVRLTKAEKKIYPHMNMEMLEQALRESKDARRRLIVTDGVFSMDGDIAPLDQIVELAEKYDAMTMVDDAHGDGVLGKDGRGIIDHFNLHGRVDIDMGTLSKAFGCLGGYIAGRRELTEYLTQTARTFLFTTAHPPCVIAACSEAIKMVQDEPQHLQNLWKNGNYLKDQLQSMGFDTGSSKTPITPVIVGDSGKAQQMSKEMFAEGVFVKAIVYPLVAKDKARLRVMPTAQHTRDDIDFCLERFERAGKKLEII